MGLLLGGLSYRGTDIQTDNLFLDLMGSLYEPAFHRGRDDIVPGRAGRYRRNRVADQRLIPLQGWTRGTGEDKASRRESFDAAEASLGALLDPAEDAGVLLVIPPYMGLAGASQSILAVVSEWTAGDVQGSLSFRRWTVVLEAVGNPPEWTEESPS